MIRVAPILSAPFCLLALAAPVHDAVAQRPRVTFFQQRIVIRVPRISTAPSAPVQSWKERKGPKCLAPGELAGAVIAEPTAVDLLLVDGRRMRARLDKDCHSANFYSGLYLRPGDDGRVCADRDAFRVRSGARCEIKGFRELSVPKASRRARPPRVPVP